MQHHLRRGVLAAALVVILALALAAATAAAQKYVALGDSYSSGVGTRTYFDTTCSRSVYAYPYLISQQRADTQLTFAACSGATTSDVLNSQISSVTSDSTGGFCAANLLSR